MLHLKAGVALSSCLMSTLPTVCGNSRQCLTLSSARTMDEEGGWSPMQVFQRLTGTSSSSADTRLTDYKVIASWDSRHNEPIKKSYRI